MMSTMVRKIQLMALLLVAVLALSACGQNTSSVTIDANGQSTIKVSPPSFLLNRAIDVDRLELLVMINDDTLTMTPRGETWNGSTTVPKNTSVTLRVEWREEIPDRGMLLLAIAEQTLPAEDVNRAISFLVVDESYVTEGEGFDEDGDLLSNIIERRQESDPYNADDPGDGPPARVRISASKRPNVIDGIFKDGSGFWNNAQFNDSNGETLRINNLIVDSNGVNVNNGPNYQWAVIHDARYLTLFVFGKDITVDGIDANGDSGTQFFRDDSLEIFWDGDLSQEEDYDTVDDMHIIIPLVRGTGTDQAANNSAAANKRIQRGSNMQTSVLFDVLDSSVVEFATCLCQGENERVTWEIRIDMEAAQIPVGKTFGFEIQINRDDDGQDRDSKWAWAAPAITPNQSSGEADRAWRYPSTFSQIKLLPFPVSN